jgi:hypothetical protein
MVEMTPQERQYRYHLYAIIQESVRVAGGPAAVGKRCGMLPHTVTALGVAHLPSLRVLLRVATAKAESRVLESAVCHELSPFFGRFAGDDFGA